MPEPSALVLFATAAFFLLVTPGPAVLFVVARSVESGARAGLVVTGGLCAGLLVHVFAVVAGVSALLAASPWAFAVLQYAGAAFLVWLGFRALKSPRDVAGSESARSTAHFREGLVVNLLNPKAALFLLAVLPQFADPARGPMAAQLLLLGAMFVALAGLIDSGYALLAGRLSGWLAESPRRARWQRLAVAATYFGLGALTVLGGPPG